MPAPFPPVRRWVIPALAWLLALGCASSMAATPVSARFVGNSDTFGGVDPARFGPERVASAQLRAAGLVRDARQAGSAEPARTRAATGSPPGPVVRCGWFDNPTPGNVWLTDRQGQWLIGEQGGYQANGDWPDFPPSRWVATNGGHGYGCACLRVLDDAAGHRILRILGGRSRPLAACLDDPWLPRRDPKADRQGF